MKKVRLLLNALVVSLTVIGLSACTSVTAPDDCPPDSQEECGVYGPNGLQGVYGPNG